MKLLFYSPIQLVSGGGCERWHCDITNSLSDDFGHRIEIVTANLGPTNWTDAFLKKQLGHTLYSKVNFLKIFGGLIPTFSAVHTLYRKFVWADVIHVIHGFIGQDILILILKILTGKKVILGWHSPIFHHNLVHNCYMRFVSRYLLNFFDGHMTLNTRDKSFLESNWGIKNVKFISSGINVNSFLSIKRKSHSRLTFLTVGHYRRQKGIDIALQSIELFNLAHPNNKANFKFVGSGEYGQLVDSYAKNHINVENLGYKKYDEIINVYALADVYLLPSREEPFGLVLIEAWSSGIPVLATPTDGPLDMVKEGVNGWVVKKIDSFSLEKGIEKIYNTWTNSPEELNLMENSCRATGKLYSIQLTAAKMHNNFFHD